MDKTIAPNSTKNAHYKLAYVCVKTETYMGLELCLVL